MAADGHLKTVIFTLGRNTKQRRIPKGHYATRPLDTELRLCSSVRD